GERHVGRCHRRAGLEGADGADCEAAVPIDGDACRPVAASGVARVDGPSTQHDHVGAVHVHGHGIADWFTVWRHVPPAPRRAGTGEADDGGTPQSTLAEGDQGVEVVVVDRDVVHGDDVAVAGPGVVAGKADVLVLVQRMHRLDIRPRHALAAAVVLDDTQVALPGDSAALALADPDHLAIGQAGGGPAAVGAGAAAGKLVQAEAVGTPDAPAAVDHIAFRRPAQGVLRVQVGQLVQH